MLRKLLTTTGSLAMAGASAAIVGSAKRADGPQGVDDARKRLLFLGALTAAGSGLASGFFGAALRDSAAAQIGAYSVYTAEAAKIDKDGKERGAVASLVHGFLSDFKGSKE